ncbi:UNVERIFIED_CONTAM: hypothetical protein DES50_103366 [Williamsia faeni]|jgi:hypothetical protein
MNVIRNVLCCSECQTLGVVFGTPNGTTGLELKDNEVLLPEAAGITI